MSHVPLIGMIADVRVVNVGSVGEAPGGGRGAHRFAHATWIESTPQGVTVEQIAVPLPRRGPPSSGESRRAGVERRLALLDLESWSARVP